MHRMPKTGCWLFLLLFLGVLPLYANAETSAAISTAMDFAAYREVYAGAANTQDMELFASAGEALEENGMFSFRVTLSEDVFGYPVFTYRMTGSNILDNAYSLLIDGEIPYDECASLTLDSRWTMTGAFDKDRYGNEVVTMPVKDGGTLQCRMLG